jgi:limonene-1,2-epoxide hydrolase
MSNTDTVKAFFAAWEAKSVEKIMDGFAPDARWLNVGLPEAVGKDAIRKMVEPFVKSAGTIQFKVHHIAETKDGTVLTERTDIFETGGKSQAFDVMGILELKDGKIQDWREYFDTRALQPQNT